MQPTLRILRHGVTASLTQGYRLAPVAREQAGPASAIDDADDAPTLADCRDYSRAEESLSRVGLTAIDHLERGPAAPLLRPAEGEELTPLEILECRAGGDAYARRTITLAPLRQHDGRLPRRRPLLLQRFVVRIENQG